MLTDETVRLLTRLRANYEAAKTAWEAGPQSVDEDGDHINYQLLNPLNGAENTWDHYAVKHAHELLAEVEHLRAELAAETERCAKVAEDADHVSQGPFCQYIARRIREGRPS